MSKIRVLSSLVLISADYRGAWMSGTVVDGNNQIKCIHAKWLIPSRWLERWAEVHEIGVWTRNQWESWKLFTFTDQGGTGIFLAKQCQVDLEGRMHLWPSQIRIAPFSQDTDEAGSTRASSSKAPGFHLCIQAHHCPHTPHKGQKFTACSSAWFSNSIFFRHPERFLLSFLCSGS